MYFHAFFIFLIFSLFQRVESFWRRQARFWIDQSGAGSPPSTQTPSWMTHQVQVAFIINFTFNGANIITEVSDKSRTFHQKLFSIKFSKQTFSRLKRIACCLTDCSTACAIELITVPRRYASYNMIYLMGYKLRHIICTLKW